MNEKYLKLVKYQQDKIYRASLAGEEMFLGIPDRWYEPVTFGCENGHISRRYLKSEDHGSLCLACQSPVVIIPNISEEALKVILE